jgi:hypothetical protein
MPPCVKLHDFKVSRFDEINDYTAAPCLSGLFKHQMYNFYAQVKPRLWKLQNHRGSTEIEQVFLIGLAEPKGFEPTTS